MRYLHSLLLLALLFSLGCGDATPVKTYKYATTKNNLEKAVTKVIQSNPNIFLDTTKPTVIVRRNPGNINDTSTTTINLSDFHEKDSASVAAYYNSSFKIRIKVGQVENWYGLRYPGMEQDWKSSKNSAIFISEVSDKYGNSISQGHNEHGQFESPMAKEFTKVLEREFVDKVDNELKLKHSVD